MCIWRIRLFLNKNYMYVSTRHTSYVQYDMYMYVNATYLQISYLQISVSTDNMVLTYIICPVSIMVLYMYMYLLQESYCALSNPKGPLTDHMPLEAILQLITKCQAWCNNRHGRTVRPQTLLTPRPEYFKF